MSALDRVREFIRQWGPSTCITDGMVGDKLKLKPGEAKAALNALVGEGLCTVTAGYCTDSEDIDSLDPENEALALSGQPFYYEGDPADPQRLWLTWHPTKPADPSILRAKLKPADQAMLDAFVAWCRSTDRDPHTAAEAIERIANRGESIWSTCP